MQRSLIIDNVPETVPRPRHLDALRAPARRSGAGVVVGVLDTGVRRSHEQFVGDDVVALAFDECGRATAIAPDDGFDGDGHGTMVCALIAGRTLGVAPGARLVVARVTGDARAVHARAVEAALEALAVGTFGRAGGALGVDVLNVSLGWPGFWAGDDARLAEGFARLTRETQTLVVASIGEADVSSGGGGAARLHSPGAYACVVGVGACGDDGAPARWSASGQVAEQGGIDKPDLLAPGVDVTSAFWLDDRSRMIASGTSYASALASGAAALCLALDPGLRGDAAALRARLEGLAPGRGALDLALL